MPIMSLDMKQHRQGLTFLRECAQQGMYDLGYLNGNTDIYSPVIDDLANAGAHPHPYLAPRQGKSRGAYMDKYSGP